MEINNDTIKEIGILNRQDITLKIVYFGLLLLLTAYMNGVGSHGR